MKDKINSTLIFNSKDYKVNDKGDISVILTSSFLTSTEMEKLIKLGNKEKYGVYIFPNNNNLKIILIKI